MSAPPTPPGRVITFYSYKGGTGRSMALANMAWLLATAGRSVVVVDWDLEAPGLHRYFHPFLSDPQLTASDGVVDFMVGLLEEASAIATADPLPPDWFAPHADITPLVNSIDYAFPAGGVLDFIPAGRQVEAYGARVNSFNWKHLYTKLGGWSVIDEMRRRLREEYEFVLVDSRTGVSDTAGICTVQIPDSVVICFTLNFQSVDGASAAARSMIEERAKRKQPPLRLFPVPMRVEPSEKLKRDAVTAYAQRQFLQLLPDLEIPLGTARERYWDEVELPHVAFYAFEEQLAWFLDKPTQLSGVLASVKRLTRYAAGLDVMDLPGPEASARAEALASYAGVWTARVETLTDATSKTLLLVSYNELDRDNARAWLARSPTTTDSVESGAVDRDVPWPEAIRAMLQRCSAMAVLIGRHGLSQRQQRELAIAYNHRLRQARAGARFPIVPVVLPGGHDARASTFLDAPVDAGSLTSTVVAVLMASGESQRPCPYPGIRPFRIEDAELFYGRELVADRLVEQVKTSQVVVVSGPSGSGRTSVVAAGLVPRLLVQVPPQPSWKIAFCSFRHSPVESLAEALVGARQTALSDAQVASEVQQATASLLSGTSTSVADLVAGTLASWPSADRLLVVADDVRDIHGPGVSALVHLLKDVPVTLVLIADGPSTLPALSARELHTAIVGPAGDAGLQVEPAVVDRLIADVAQEPDGLTLMQFCLQRLYEERSGTVLTLSAYEGMGGAQQAIALWIESRLAAAPDVMNRGWRVLSRLVVPDAAHGWIGRRVSAEAFDAEWRADAERLMHSGLVQKHSEAATGSTQYSWSHDVLFRHWPQFLERLEANAKALALRHEVESQALVWLRGGDVLLLDAKLAQATGLLTTGDIDLTTTEKQFVEQSVAAAEHRQKQDLGPGRSARRQGLLAGTITAAAIGAFMLLGLSPWWTAPGAARLEKVEGDGQTIATAEGGYRNFVVKVVDSSGAAVAGAKVAWQTPECGDRMFVGQTDAAGLSSATNMCSPLQPGQHEQRAMLVDPATPTGFVGQAPKSIGDAAVFTFRFAAEPTRSTTSEQNSR